MVDAQLSPRGENEPAAAPTQAALIESLSRASAYPHKPREVELVQTHISIVFLAGDRVYKVKKAVDLGFVDYTTLERRRRFCEEEVRLNRRLAPDVYLGVVEITRASDGSLRIGGAGETVDVAVEMKRLPANRMLDRLLEAGEIDNAQMEALAALLTGFHAAAPTGPAVDQYGTPEAVAFNVRENLEQTAGFAALPGNAASAGVHSISSTLHKFLHERAERFLTDQRGLLETRVRGGHIRDGHGDLHAGNVCLTDEGIVVYDCIEFAPRFRCGDVGCDLAFLAMDLDHRGFRAFSRYLVLRYAEHAGDAEIDRLIGFYKSYRAIVRAKVASFAAVDPGLEPVARESKRVEAFSYFHLAASYELGSVLILTCGLPASGKSTVARHLARPFEAAMLRSDARRKQLAGLRRTARASADYRLGIYTPEMTDRTYGSLLTDAEAILRNGRSVVVDASFARAAQREPFLELARRLGVPRLVVETKASEETTRARMATRSRDRREVSDADYRVYLQMRETYEPPRELPDPHVLAVDEAETREDTVARAIDKLVEQAR